MEEGPSLNALYVVCTFCEPVTEFQDKEGGDFDHRKKTELQYKETHPENKSQEFFQLLTSFFLQFLLLLLCK